VLSIIVTMVIAIAVLVIQYIAFPIWENMYFE
jgi:hypothetical protein